MPHGPDLAAAAAAALALVDDDEEIAAVLPCDPQGRGDTRFLCALRAGEGDDDLTGWVVVDALGQPVRSEDEIRRAASIVALCETAEEAAGITEIDALVAAIERARSIATDPALAEALAGCEPAAVALAANAAGIRVASDAYVDSLGRELLRLDAALITLRPLAERLSSGLSGEPGDAAEPLARAVWEVVGRVTQAGGPARLADQVGAATGAIEAFASDVVLGYRIPLEHEEEAHL